MTELRDFLGNTSEALESVKYGELSNLSKNLLTLEQKVAKWVHSSQMPAKVSEARLYALEAKMAGEMEHRLQLEEVVKESRGPSRNNLPTLPSSRPSTRARPQTKASLYSTTTANEQAVESTN